MGLRSSMTTVCLRGRKIMTKATMLLPCLTFLVHSVASSATSASRKDPFVDPYKQAYPLPVKFGRATCARVGMTWKAIEDEAVQNVDGDRKSLWQDCNRTVGQQVAKDSELAMLAKLPFCPNCEGGGNCLSCWGNCHCGGTGDCLTCNLPPSVFKTTTMDLSQFMLKKVLLTKRKCRKLFGRASDSGYKVELDYMDIAQYAPRGNRWSERKRHVVVVGRCVKPDARSFLVFACVQLPIAKRVKIVFELWELKDYVPMATNRAMELRQSAKEFYNKHYGHE